MSVRNFFIFSLFLAIIPTASHPQTHVCGYVSGVWGPEGNPYMADSTLTIPDDSSLVLLPGVNITFNTWDSLYVLGEISAVGNETDSIVFTWRGCVPMFSSGIHLLTDDTCHFVYCKIDTPGFAIKTEYSNVMINNCELSGLTKAIHINHDSYAEIIDCSTWGYNSSIELSSNCNAIIADNYVDGYLFFPPTPAGITILTYSYATVINNECTGNITYWRTSGEIIANSANSINVTDLANGTVLIENNKTNAIEVDDYGLATIRNNSISYLSIGSLVFATEVLADSNIITGSVNIRHDLVHNVVLSRNLITNGIEVADDATASFYNNTIYANEENIGIDLDDFWGEGQLGEAVNNIILGMGVGGAGINGSGNGIVSYNCIYGFASPWLNIGSSSNNILENPELTGGNPFEYGLQANSPCIDAGNPAYPNDPDSSRCDIGAFYYNQNIDNPPVVASPAEAIATLETEFTYSAYATDDFGPLTVTLSELPEWLEIAGDPDWVSDTVIVTGYVPVNQEDFSFLATAEDGLGQQDRQRVFVDVTNLFPISGEMSGVLSIDHSPYLCTGNLIINIGDTLAIDPGVEIYFKHYSFSHTCPKQVFLNSGKGEAFKG